MACSGIDTWEPRADHPFAMRSSGQLVAGLLVLGACTGGSAHRNSGSSSVGSTPAAAPASANVTLQGDGALTAALTKPSVRCSFPDVDGPSIALLSTPEGLVFRIRVQQGEVTVLVSDTAGAAPHERDFAGTGVTMFDAGRGALVDSPLTEVPTTAGTPGAIGVLTAIQASVDCAGQEPGTSTVALTGETAEGPLTAATLQTPRVECNLAGSEVVLVGIVNVAGRPVFVDLGLRPDGIDVNKTVDDTRHHFVSPPGAVALRDNGARVNGDVTEQGGAAPPHVLHVEGEAVCGTPVN